MTQKTQSPEAAIDLPARIEKLEEALAHALRLGEDLSAEVARQEAEITRLARRVHLLMERAAEAEMNAGGTVPLADQRPPHW
ncbi:SlyX family protein [Phaeovulum vinaykumarii]|uniref:SlyX protein n=1 Tax=Phaeovulum vinaykumarii TaxID=407234 RepID=A0A1N7MEN5_9RHOB|nr:SlyX family protein [Phaeovulum vinaykumarii]SIS84482.1 SlyX protein [Phaeovulum vinaykumarii]SOC11792.1 SlyX protein [Phaeovulum vinaykumarii]